ncbi:MAG: hypothetical protein ACI8S6_001029 [Myxococcota bacterium]|jgi:hypothetical protein
MWSWIEGAAEVGQALSTQLERVVREAEKLGEEAVDLAMRVWDQLDDLPFVPDAFRIPPITRQLYAHGAFMGAAPALLADERWRRILAFLMPDVYADVTEALRDGKSPSALIPMFENNPVMAAFGIWRSAQSDEDQWELDQVGVEWDLFIDGELAEAFEGTPEADRPALVEAILASAVVAHAAALDTLQENLGFCQHDDVRGTRKAKLGGVEVSAWLDLFARAFRLAEAEDPARLLLAMAAEGRVQEGEACLLHTFTEPISPAEAVETFCAVTGRERFSVVLDMKSLRSTPALFGALIGALNTHGIHVTAACSFALEEIEGLSQMMQHVGGIDLPGPREVLFFHYAGDLQRACDAGTVPSGMSVLFNGGSLLSVDSWFSKTPNYTINAAVIEDLARYQRRHDLQIGLYVQEGDCDSAAAALLGELVEAHGETFRLGFAWGGLREEVAFEPGGEPRMGHGSQLALSFIGKANDWVLPED